MKSNNLVGDVFEGEDDCRKSNFFRNYASAWDFWINALKFVPVPVGIGWLLGRKPCGGCVCVCVFLLNLFSLSYSGDICFHDFYWSNSSFIWI